MGRTQGREGHFSPPESLFSRCTVREFLKDTKTRGQVTRWPGAPSVPWPQSCFPVSPAPAEGKLKVVEWCVGSETGPTLRLKVLSSSARPSRGQASTMSLSYPLHSHGRGMTILEKSDKNSQDYCEDWASKCPRAIWAPAVTAITPGQDSPVGKAPVFLVSVGVIISLETCLGPGHEHAEVGQVVPGWGMESSP